MEMSRNNTPNITTIYFRQHEFSLNIPKEFITVEVNTECQGEEYLRDVILRESFCLQRTGDAQSLILPI